MAEDVQNLGLGVAFSATISEFTSQIAAIENKLKEFASRLESLQGTADKTGKALTSANKDAEKAITQVTAATKEASAASAEASKVADKLSSSMTKNKESVSGAATAAGKAAIDYKGLNFQTMNLLGSTKGIAENILPSLVNRLKAASGESEGYRSALIKLASDANGSNVKFDEYSNTLKKVERNLLQTESAFGKVRGQLGAGALPKDLSNWANGVDRVRAVQATLNGELFKSQGVIVNTSGNFLSLQRTLASMKKEYGEAAWAATDMDGRLGSYVKTVSAARAELSNYVKNQIPFNKYMTEAEKAIQSAAIQMNAMGKSGTAWAEGVDKGRVATAFMNGEIVNANGTLLQYGKTTAQVRAEVEKAGAGFRKELGRETFDQIRSQLGTTIPTIDKFKATLTATANEIGRTHDKQQLYNRAQTELRNITGLSTSAQNLFATSVASGYRSLESAVTSAENLVKKQTEMKMSAQTLAENQSFLSLRFKDLVNSQNAYGESARSIISNMESSRQGYRLANEQLIQLNKSMREAEQASSSWNKILNSTKSTTAESKTFLASLNEEVKKGNVTHAEAISKWKDHQTALASAGNAAKSSGTFWDGLHSKLTGTASAAGSATNFMARLGSAVGSLAAWIPAALIIGAMTKAVTDCMEAIKNYDQSLKTLEAISGGTKAEISILGKEILKISDNTKYSADEIAKGAVYIAQAGFSASESLKVIGAAAQGAQGTLESLTVASDLLTTVLRSFNIDASKASSVMDMLAVAANQSKTNLEGLKTMFNYLGPVAHSAGLSLDETLGAVMALSNVGIKASTVGTSFRQVLIQLENPNKKFRDAIKESGLSLEDFNVKSNGLIKVLQNMNTVIGGDFAKAAAFFNVRAGNSALVLSQMNEHVALMIKSTQEYGAAAIMAGTQSEGLSVKLEILGNRFKNMIIRLSEGGLTDFFGKLVSLVTSVISVLNNLLDNPLAKMAVSFLLVATAIGIFNQALIYLATKIGITAFFTSFIALLESYVVANYAAISASSGFATILLYLNGVLKALWATMLKHPLTALAAITAAVVVGIYEYTHAGEKASIAAQEQTIKYNDLAVSAANYADQLLALNEKQKNGSVVTTDYHAILTKVKETMPELSKAMLAANNNLEAQAAVLKQAAAGYEVIKNTKAEEAIKRITEQEDAAIKSGLSWYQKIQYVGQALSEETKKVLLNTMSYEDNLRVRASLNQYAKEKAAQILMMNEANRLTELEKLAGTEYGKLVKQIVDGGIALKKSLEDQGRSVTDETVSNLSQLSEEWQNYYKQQDAAGQAHLDKVMQQAINTGKKAAEQAKKNSQDEEAARSAAQNEALNKEIERRQKQGETVLKIIDQLTKDRVSAVKAGYAAEQEVADAEEKLQLARLRNEVSIEEDYLKQKQVIEEKYANESLLRTQESTDKSIEIIKRAGSAQLEIINKSGQFVDKQAEYNKVLKKTAEEEIAIYQNALTKYKSIIDSKISEVNRYKSEYLAAMKAISDAEKNYAKINQDLEDMKREALRSTMTDAEKGRDTLLRYEEYTKQAFDALSKAESETTASGRKADLDTMKEYLDKAKSMINEVAEYTISSDGKTVVDAQRTADTKIKLIDQMREMYKTLYDTTAKYAKDEADAAQAAGKSAEEIVKNMTEAVRQVQGELSKAVELKLDTSQAVETLQKAVKVLDETFDKKKYEVQIAFLGIASPPAPLMETISNIKTKMGELETLVKEYKVTLSFLATIGGESAAVPFTDALTFMQNKITAFNEQLKTVAPSVSFQFVGYGTSSKNEWLSEAYILAKSGADWLNQQVNNMITYFKVTFLGDGQPLATYLTTIESSFSSLKSKIESLSATYTITTRYVTEGSSTTSASGESTEEVSAYAEGGSVPGVGDTDSVQAALTPGEFVIRKSVVSALGEGFFRMINNMRSFSVPRINTRSIMPAYAEGGLVKNHEVFTLNLSAGSAKVPLKVVGSPGSVRTQIKQLEKELSKMRLGYV
ncbi:MAG: phage tail tape measure protein [Methanogenium sp.]|jgi:TP901 family phage tail tape measure protein